MASMRGGLQPPCPPVLSLVTGERSYDDFHARDILRDWVDHPQRLWDAVYETLSSGITTVIHVGPGPNVIPATFHRLGENVTQQMTGSTLGHKGMPAAARPAMTGRPLPPLALNSAAILKTEQTKDDP